jgi:hypothetical protein
MSLSKCAPGKSKTKKVFQMFSFYCEQTEERWQIFDMFALFLLFLENIYIFYFTNIWIWNLVRTVGIIAGVTGSQLKFRESLF